MSEVYLRVKQGKSICFVGSWPMPGSFIDNYEQQKDLGWHIFMSLQNGADSVEVVYGDQEADYKQYKEGRK